MSRRRFQTPRQMRDAIDLYFETRESFDQEGNLVMTKPVTQSGMARALGFSSIAAMRNYEGYDHGDFKAALDEAKLRIGEYLEEKLIEGKSPAWNLLKNLDKEHWRDRTEQAVEVEDKRKDWTEVERANRLSALIENVITRSVESDVDVLAVDADEDDDSWI